MSRSRFCGEANAYDSVNGKVYLGDLVYSWSLGDSLTGFTLGGTTNPTISMDGQIDLYDATNLNDQPSFANYTLPNSVGGGYYIIHCKFTRMLDDSSTDILGFIITFRPLGGAMNVTNGAGYWYNQSAGTTSTFWNNTYDVGTNINVTNPPIGAEQALDIVVTPKDVIYIMNNIPIASFPTGKKGTAGLTNTPIRDFFSYQKNILFWTRHDAGQISHYRIRQARVSRLVGISSM